MHKFSSLLNIENLLKSWMVFLSIIRSPRLYVQHQVYVI